MTAPRAALRAVSPTSSVGTGLSATVVPVLGPDLAPIGTVVYRQRRVDGDMFLEVHYQGAVALIPCRRASDVTRPHCFYVLEDGRVWMAADNAVAPGRIVAEVVVPAGKMSK